MFYTFIQNATFGYMKGPANYVCVEASSPEEANAIAQKYGVYFQIECTCCGSRWGPMHQYSKATEIPQVFGEPIEKQSSYMIIYKDGRIVLHNES